LEIKPFSRIIVLVPIDRNSLPNDPAILQQMLVDLTTQLDKTNRLLRQLLEAKHSTRSEQLSPDQLHLFLQQLKADQGKDEEGHGGTNQEDGAPPAAGCGEVQGAGQPRGRRPLAPQLKRERIEHDLSEAEKHCVECDQDLRPIGEETSER
jgi:transposase